MTPTDVRARHPFFVPSRSCVCVSVEMCFERTLLPNQHAITATFYVCVNCTYILCAASAVRLAMGLLAAARAAARRRFICGRREVAREQPEVRRPVARNNKVLPEPRVPDHRRRVAADEHGPPRLEAVVVVELVRVSVPRDRALVDRHLAVVLA